MDELLQSLTRQSFKDFEVIVVEDGSSIPCKPVIEKHQELLDVHYYDKPNSGPGQTRNYGAERSKGEYLIILDSDCILPEGYFHAVEKELQHEAADAFGGPDRGTRVIHRHTESHQLLHDLLLHHRRIRGGKKKMDKFYPRSFNMGVRREVYQALGGFSRMRFGEDIDFSIRIFKGGHTCRLFPGAWVYHKRRTDFRKFFKQVHNRCPHQSVQEVSGITEARPSATCRIHPGSGHIPAGNALLSVQSAAHRSLCASGMHRLHYPEP